VRFGLRQVRRTPMVSLFIVATLAVGIGATAAIFSAVDTMLLRPIYTNEHLGICGAHQPGIPGQATFEPLWERLVEQTGIAPARFLPRRGQALIWAANLLHGGDVHRDRKRTRHSQVTHYYFDDCTYYTPMHSDPFYGSIAYRRLVDISTGKEVPNQCGGYRVPDAFINQVQYQIKG